MDNTGESWVAKFYLNLAHNMFLYLLECAITQEPPTISDLMGVLAYSVMGTIQNISKELLVLVNGSVAVIVSILNGESLSAAVCNGLIAATLTMTTFGFTNKYFNFAKKDDDLSLIIADTIFDYAKTTIVSAISRATSSKVKDKSNEKDVSTGLKGDNRKRTFSMLPGARNMLDRYSYDYWRWC